MSAISTVEFNKIFQSKFLPVLRELEPQRIKVYKAFNIAFSVVFLCFLLIIISFPVESTIKIPFLNELRIALLIPGIISMIILFGQNKGKQKLKKTIVSKILLLFGNLYISDKKDIIKLGEIKNWGLFHKADQKTDDDIIIGLYKGCNFMINECCLSHTESRGKHSSTTVYDFKGFIFQIQMKKPFTGTTVVGIDGKINKFRGSEKVELESIDFMKDRKVYSTDQIESRYILTTALMERLDNLGKIFLSSLAANGVNLPETQIRGDISNELEHLTGNSFIDKNISSFISRQELDVSAVFTKGYAYIFVPAGDLFEIDISKTFLQPEQFYNIYLQIITVLELIDYMKLDKNLGL